MKINKIKLSKIEENVLRVSLDHFEEYLDDIIKEVEENEIFAYKSRREALEALRFIMNRKI